MTIGGLGDQFLLASAAEEYYRKTGEKLLLAVEHSELFFNNSSFYVLNDISAATIHRMVIDNLSLLEQGEIVLNNVKMKFHIVYGAIYSIDQSGKYVFNWPDIHYFGQFLRNLGLSGKVVAAPRIHLTNSEKKTVSKYIR